MATVRGFFIYSQSWYAQHIPQSNKWVDEITIGKYTPGGGVISEFAIKWIALGDSEIVPQLQVFDDAWKLLVVEFQDLLAFLAANDDRNITPLQISERLMEMGMVDFTARVREDVI